MKYDVRICSCGRIHVVDSEKAYKALEENSDTILICAGCGSATLFGADIVPDYDDIEKEVYELYSRSFSNDKSTEITEDIFKDGSNKKVKSILYSQGIKVPMKNGEYASSYFDGKFSSLTYPDLYKIDRDDITAKEVREFISDFNRNRTTVDMERFIDETPDDVLESVSKYFISGFDWTGTKYESR